MLLQEFPISTLPRFGAGASGFPDSSGMPAPRPEAGMPHVVAGAAPVLIVEDDRISRRTLAQLLKASGYPAVVAGSAEEALSLVGRGGMPRLALVDLHLPGMDGMELIDRLTEMDPTVTPVVVTAAGEEELSERLRTSGVAFLRKPIDFRRLMGLLQDTCDRGGPATARRLDGRGAENGQDGGYVQ